MKELTSRQSIIIMFLCICATKFFILPERLFENSNQDIIYTLLIFMCLELFMYFIIIYVSVKNPNKTFFDIIGDTFGKFYGKLIALILFAYFILKCLIAINETYTFFLNTLYDYISPILFIVPLLIFIFYVSSSGLKSIGRTSEILWGLVFFGLVVTICIAVTNADFKYLLPIYENGIWESFDSLQENIFWFGDFFVFLMFMGKIKFSKGYTWKLLLSMFIAIVIIIMFFAIYYCVYPHNAHFHNFAISDLSNFSPNVSNFGRIDWFTVTIWTVGALIQCCIFAFSAMLCIKYIFKFKENKVPSYINIGLLAVLLYIFSFNMQKTVLVVTSPIRFIIFYLIFSCIVLLPIHNLILNKRSNSYAKKFKS